MHTQHRNHYSMAGAVTRCDSHKTLKVVSLLILVGTSCFALPEDAEFYGMGYPSPSLNRGKPTRFKRQADRNQILNDIFQIPIQTLTAVQTLLQHTRPVFPNLYTAPPPASGGAASGGGGGGFFGQAPGTGAGAGTYTRPRPPVSAPAAAAVAPASRPPPFLGDFFGRPRPSRGPLTFGANAVQVRPASDGSSFKI